MSLNISSEKIDNPLLIDLLRQLNHTFSRIGNDFFVIGGNWSYSPRYYSPSSCRHIREKKNQRSGYCYRRSGLEQV